MLRFIDSLLWIMVVTGFAVILLCITEEARNYTQQTQPAIQTVIVSVRGCDVIQHIQNDTLIAAHNAADQPKTCKVAK